MTRVVITGAKGQMGKTLIACATRIPDLQITGQIDLGDKIEPLLGGCDVVVDFSFHDATAPLAKLCAKHSKALVIGTTGTTNLKRKRS